MFEVGEKVVILKSDYPSLIGKTAIVMQNDVINGIKVKVSFDEKWQGYYLPSQLARYSDFIKNENTTLFINLFGAPGAGKSTGATYVFSQLKLRGIDSEYIGEFAKDKCWEKNKFMFESPENQLYIGAKQFYRVNQIDGKVRVAVTDSPIFLNSYYNRSEYLGKEYNTVMLRLFNKFNNLNFYIERVKPYNPNGRNQTESESEKMGSDLREYITQYNIPFFSVTGDEYGYRRILDIVLDRIGVSDDSI